MNILGIDCGLERLGWAVFSHTPNESPRYTYAASGLIKTSAKQPTHERLLVLFDQLNDVVKKHHVDHFVIEQLFFFKNQKTVIPVAQSQGAVMLSASQNGLPLEFLTPLQIKQIVTGYGNADKESVKKMIHLQLPDIELKGKIDDEIDAIACSLAYCCTSHNLL